jgi:hypothetical protein
MAENEGFQTEIDDWFGRAESSVEQAVKLSHSLVDIGGKLWLEGARAASRMARSLDRSFGEWTEADSVGGRLLRSYSEFLRGSIRAFAGSGETPSREREPKPKKA